MPAGAPAPAVNAPASPDAESSLVIKRGTVALNADTRVLRLCGQSEDLWLVQQDDQAFDDTYAKLAGEPGTLLFVELRGERVASPQGTVIPASFKQAFIVEELLYAGVPSEGGGCAAPAPAYRALARGNEPFWSVEIDREQMLLRQPDEPAPSKYSVQETQDAEGSVTYRGASGDKALEITVTNNPCSDSMSGEYFAYTADLNLQGRVLRGCARIGE
jgi:putative lipoprotein